MSASLSSRPSFAWRSILHGRDLLTKGLHKLVGNVLSLHVWTDPWIRDHHMRRPLIKNPIIDIDLRVSDLIDYERRDWIKEKLDDLFYPEDIKCILKSRPVISKDDFWVWGHNRSGDYSVKSGYWPQYQFTNSRLLVEASALPSVNELKIQVWSLNTSPKIKTFLWKVLSEAIPVADMIISRGMNVDSRCQVCGLEGESINHLLFSCTVARQVWALSLFPRPHSDFSSDSLYSNFHHLLKVSKSSLMPFEITRMFPWVLWHIWKSRNIFTFEGRGFCPLETLKKIRQEVDAWFLAQKAVAEQNLCQEIPKALSNRSWIPPSISWIKCNLTYSWDKNFNLAGVAWLLRNHQGQVLLHSRHAISDIDSLAEAKLQCLLWAIKSISDLKLSQVIFGSEASELIGAVTGPKAWPSFAFQALEINLALSKIRKWKLHSETAATNQSAYLIAQSASFGRRIHSYVAYGAPFWLRNTLDNDMVIL